MEAPHSHKRVTQGKDLPVISPETPSNSTHTCLFNKSISKHSVNTKCDCSQGHNTPAKAIKPSWTAGTLYSQLAKTNKGPVGSTYSIGVRDRIHLRTLPVPETHPNPIKSRPAKAGVSGDHRNDLKRGGIRDTNPTRGEFFLHPLSSTKERRRPEACHKSKKTQFFHKCPALQDGGNPHPQKPAQERRLAYKDRLERCLFFNPHKTTTQEVPVLPIRKQSIPLQLPPIRSGLSPMGLYQDPKADSSSRTGAGDTVGGIHRRHSPNGRDQGEGQRPRVWPDTPFSMSRVHNKLGEDNTTTIPVPRIPRFYGRFHQDGAEPPSSKNEKDSGGVSTTAGGGACDMLRPLKVNWQNERHKPSNSTSSSLLQEPTDRPGISPQGGEPGLRDNPCTVSRQQGGTNLVGHTDDKLEWQSATDNGARPDHRIRCLDPGLGRLSSGLQHRGTLVLPREGVPYKLSGTASGDSSSKDVCQTHDRNFSINEDRQHDSSCLYQQSGRNGIQRVDIPDPEPMDVVSGEEHPYPSSAPTWCIEPGSRQGIQVHEGQIRLESESLNISKKQQGIWATGSGPICIQTNQSVPTLLQLAARSICRGNRRIPPGLDNNERLCQPPLEPGPQGTNKNTSTGGRCNSDSPCLEDTAVVSPPIVVDSRLATPTTPPETQYRVSTHNAPISRLEHLREGLSNQGLSGQATDLIINSWRVNHTTHYSADGIAGVLNGVQIPFQDL